MVCYGLIGEIREGTKMAEKDTVMKKAKRFVMTEGRKESLKKAQKVHVILLNIGKKHRNEEVNKFPLLKKGYYPSGYKRKKK
jgi:hypothetical protein